MAHILIVATSTDEYRKAGYRTGLWLAELTHFWDVADEAGHTMDIASPAGGVVPIDPESLLISGVASAVGLDGKMAKRYEDRAFMDRLRAALPLAEVRADDYDAIYLTGGHGTMFDFVEQPALARLIAAFWGQGKIVSAVCHGPSGLLDVKLDDGKPLLAGRKVTGFSWAEEKLARRDEAVPFNLQERLEALANYDKARIPFAAHVVEDDRLITGQNPSSAHAVAEAVVKALANGR